VLFLSLDGALRAAAFSTNAALAVLQVAGRGLTFGMAVRAVGLLARILRLGALAATCSATSPAADEQAHDAQRLTVT
jgi:hypothetical protein